MPKQRIDKILASQNIASRGQIKNMIKRGAVTVDGITVKRPDEKYDAEVSRIAVNGNEITYKKNIYIMMNKPKGVLSASNDKYEKTVIDLLSPELKRKGLFPAGRLDKDTEGFLLITDDGKLAHQMLSPKNHVYKLYMAETDKILTQSDADKFKEGIKYGETAFLPAEMKITDKNTALVEICEGKFHQIKKMFNAVGANVLYLKRLKIGNVFLDENLKPGEYRELFEHEKIDILQRTKSI